MTAKRESDKPPIRFTYARKKGKSKDSSADGAEVGNMGIGEGKKGNAL